MNKKIKIAFASMLAVPLLGMGVPPVTELLFVQSQIFPSYIETTSALWNSYTHTKILTY